MISKHMLNYSVTVTGGTLQVKQNSWDSIVNHHEGNVLQDKKHHFLSNTISLYSYTCSPVWARERCRISPLSFLAECCKRQLNQGVLFCCILGCLLFLICIEFVCVFSCTVLFASISQVTGWEDRLRNDLYCVEWGVKTLLQPTNHPTHAMQNAAFYMKDIHFSSSQYHISTDYH